MRVNDGTKKRREISIDELTVGETFMCKRSSNNEDGYYMVINGHTNCFAPSYSRKDSVYVLAVNLESGQVRVFCKKAHIERVALEVERLGVK